MSYKLVVGLVLLASLVSCVNPVRLVKIHPNCPAIPDTTFEKVGLDVTAGALQFGKLVTVGEVSFKSDPGIISGISQSVRDDQTTDALICASRERGELKTLEQINHAWKVARFYRTNPTPAQAMEFDKQNPFPVTPTTGSMGTPSERKLVELVMSDGKKVSCLAPPPDVIVKGGKVNIDLTVLRLGEVLEANAEGDLNVERIRQELPPEVSAFEVIEYRICVQYANGITSKQAYQAFNERIMPAYTKNPPAKIVSTGGDPVTAKLVEVCGPSFTTKRPAGQFVTYWANNIVLLSEKRNPQHRDLQNLLLVRGRRPVDSGGIDPFEEINFTLECLERLGYLKTEKSDLPPPDNVVKGFIGPVIDNRKIVFLKPSLTIP